MRAVDRYRPQPIELPPGGIDHPKVKPVADVYAELREQERRAAARYAELQEARSRAMQADRQALADAKRAGKPDPGYDAVTKADEAIDAQRRELEALEVAVDDQRGELVAAVAKYRGDYAKRIDGQTAQARKRYAEAVEALAEAHAQLADAASVRLWLDGFPESTRWRPALVRVASLRTPAGEPYDVASVLDGLREHAEPPQPATALTQADVVRRKAEAA